MLTTIIENGDHYIQVTDSPGDESTVNYSASSKVKIKANIDGATVIVGEDDGTGAKVNDAYADGDITAEGGKFDHGVGERLLVTVTGLGANPLVINHRPA